MDRQWAVGEWVARLLMWFLAGCVPAALAQDQVTLDDPASAVQVSIDGRVNVAGAARFQVSDKTGELLWRMPETGGGDALTITAAPTVTATKFSAAVRTQQGYNLTLTIELLSADSAVQVTLGGSATAITNGVLYPYALYTADGSGYAAVPVTSGYLVPTTNLTWKLPAAPHRMPWYGGTDADNGRGWVAIVETPDDMEMAMASGQIGATGVRGPVARFFGSNGNPGKTTNLLSYDRITTYRFFTTGGYVALAKAYRRYAASQGWLKTFAEKRAESGAADLTPFIGAPVIYLWGDGRSLATLDAMQAAGIKKALIQVSVNQVDAQGEFPAHGLTGTGWAAAVRAHGYVPGFYDLYEAALGSSSSTQPPDGMHYLWPSEALTQWLRIDATGAADATNAVAMNHQAGFAAATRLPAHRTQFDIDAYFFDTVCAASLREDYGASFGYDHFASRTQDRNNRIQMLSTAYADPTGPLITGTEQGRDWAVPYAHWFEGKFWLGQAGAVASADLGGFNDNSYPAQMVDMIDPRQFATAPADRMAALLSEGYQVPLWDLVYHDCVATTVHWSRPHNKFLYLWDQNDLWALLRGAPPLLNLTYAGAQGVARRTPVTLHDNTGQAWSTRWTDVGARVVQCCQTVGGWNELVAELEMTDHRRLTSDHTVHLAEFSSDGGASGRGIVVNFGVYDGATGVTGAAWSGTVHGQTFTVAPGRAQTYLWPTPVSPVITVPPVSITVAMGHTGVFQVTATGTGPLHFQWRQGDETVGGDEPTLTLPNVQPAQAGAYTVTVTNAQGSVTSAPVSLTVQSPAGTPPVATRRRGSGCDLSCEGDDVCVGAANAWLLLLAALGLLRPCCCRGGRFITRSPAGQSGCLY